MELMNKWLMLLTNLLIRFVFFAGLAYAVFYYWKRRQFLHLKIQKVFPSNKLVRFEIYHSLLTILIFSVVGFATAYALFELGISRMYFVITDYSWYYFVFSIIAAMFLHDTYFYWLHRFMHLKIVFKVVHSVHHKSFNPTPFSSFSFHPIEAIIEALIFPIIILVLPIHPIALGIWAFFMTSLNVMGHLGFEIFPKWFIKNKFVNWLNSSTHHNMHHHYSKCNYGLYFNFWDRIMNTNHKNYVSEFEAVKNSTKYE